MAMKIILNQDVPNLGEEGDVREVKRGYGRNYLIPQGLAVPYSKQTVAMFESRKTAIEKRKQEKRDSAKGLKDQLELLELSFSVPAGDNGKLFGSVTNAIVADELAKHGFSVERKKIEIPEHAIKMSGTYTAKVKLYGNETATIKIAINTKKEEKPEAAPAEKDASAEETAPSEEPAVQE